MKCVRTFILKFTLKIRLIILILQVREKDVSGPFATRRRMTRTQRLQPMQAEFKPLEPGSYVGSIEYEVVDSHLIITCSSNLEEQVIVSS